MIQLHFIIEVHGHATHRKNGGGHFVNFLLRRWMTTVALSPPSLVLLRSLF